MLAHSPWAFFPVAAIIDRRNGRHVDLLRREAVSVDDHRLAELLC